MASWSSKAVTRGEEDGGQEEQNMISSDSSKRYGKADLGREGREVGWIWWIAQIGWACWFWIIGLCRSQGEPTLDQSFQAEATSDRSWYHSPRIQRMMDRSGEFSSEVETSKVEFEIEASKVHWSEVDRAVSETVHSAEANRKHFEVLRRRRYVRDQWGQLVSTHLECIDEELPGWSLFDSDGCWSESLGGGRETGGGRAGGDLRCFLEVGD